jgi:hypothetical protein
VSVPAPFLSERNYYTNFSLDTQENCGGGFPTFRQYKPAAFKALKQEYMLYVKHIVSLANGATPVAVQKSLNFQTSDLQYSKGGLPSVPAAIRNDNNVETNMTQQQIIRAYLSKHYSTGSAYPFIQDLTGLSDLASGRDGPIPYKAISSNWQEFIDKSDLPPNVPFQDPSRYLTDSSNQILKLWRDRQERGEIPFQFKFIVGRGKEMEPSVYPNGAFEGLSPAALIAEFNKSVPIHLDIETDSSEDTDVERPVRRTRVPLSEEEEEKTNEDEVEVQGKPGKGKKTKRGRNIIQSDEDVSPRPIPLVTPRASPQFLQIDSSPTLAGSSPMIGGKATPIPIRKAPRVQVMPLTPEPSQNSTPAPEHGRELRPRTRPMATMVGTASSKKSTAGAGKTPRGKAKVR